MSARCGGLRRLRFALLGVWAAGFSAAGAARAAEPVDFVHDVKPMLAKHCLACHSAVRQKSGYRVDTAAGVIRGGDNGPAVLPGRSDESPLVHAVVGSHDHPRMPPEEAGPPLDPSEVTVLRRWIDAGAPAPPEKPIADPRAHWAFQAVKRPAVPANPGDWGRNPVDAFILAEQNRRGLAPAPEAPKHVLLRRVYLDLIGLPPTRAELQAFLDDDAPDAYDQVVDRLLSSPHYGERWGRHWMDVWRYSDWAGWGKQVRDSQPHIWHWRDWIIEQLNADRPYDEMVTAMLAADERTPTDRSELRATGFLARNYKRLSREQWLQDTVEHTFKSLLGLTMNCARCHDHMSDPIEQQEYYAFRAIFEPHQVRIDRLPGSFDTEADGLPRVFDQDLKATTYLYVRGDERNPNKDRSIPPGVPALLGGEYVVRDVSLPPEAVDPLRHELFVRDDLAAAERQAVEAEKKLADLRRQPDAAKNKYDVRIAELNADAARLRRQALEAVTQVERREAAGDSTSEAWKTAAELAVAAQRKLAVAEARLALVQVEHAVAEKEEELKKAKAAAGAAADETTNDKLKPLVMALGKVVESRLAAKTKLADAETTAARPASTNYVKRKLEVYPAHSTGRRSALARWIVDPTNPLTARVAVNHLWGRHFDRAIVATTANFGTLGALPTHQELLDWLAAELVEPTSGGPSHGGPAQPWSFKHLHRLIVTSSTYRQSSHWAETAGERMDPDNLYLARFPTRRLEAEVVRDCVLAAAGELDRTPGGPDIDHGQGLSNKRRSLYFRHAAEKQMTFLKLFDMAAVTECYERRESVMPQQALALANSELTVYQSRLLARRLHESTKNDDGAFVAAAYESVITRSPGDAESAECRTFLTRQADWFTANRNRLTGAAGPDAGGAKPLEPDDGGAKPSSLPQLRAREMLVHALFNHHEFVTLP